MPRKVRGSGFTRKKGGRFHSERKGKSRESSRTSDTMVGELRDDLTSPTPSVSSLEGTLTSAESEDSNVTSVFRDALSPSSDADMGSEIDTQKITNEEDLINTTRNLISAVVPKHWMVVTSEEGFHVVQLSRGSDPAIQRNVNISYAGNVRVTVHRKLVSQDLTSVFLLNWEATIPLTHQNYRLYVDRVLSIVLSVRSYEICAGADNVKYEHLWSDDSSGEIDKNPYDETRYVKTFRSSSCSLLVPVQIWKCNECKNASRRFRVRLSSHLSDEAHPHTRNTYLDEAQKKNKMKNQSKKLKAARRKIDYLHNKVQQLLNEKGVSIDEDLGNDFSEILRDSKLTPIQQLFLQQQHKAATAKKSCGMRWHPAMIRLALLIKSTSSAAYSAIQSSGVLKFPSDRTLFDYTHAVPQKEGLFHDKVNSVGDKVSEFKEKHEEYHVSCMDEIHISQKLVYRKGDGALIGYVKLNEVESELKSLTEIIEGKTTDSQPDVASKILTYMIKGATNSVKEVIAAYPVSKLTKEQLFDRTWDVISACEWAGIKILALVCDGSAVNRSFIAMHTPATPSTNGVVFDTINMCAPERKLFFISDPPHLLKTIRNCFAKSGTGKKCTRLLIKNGQPIVWKLIERLFMEDVKLTVRRCYKLNSQNVYLNSYSCMKVSYAANVLSKSVGMDLRDRNWPNTDSAVEFILKTNDMFDCLNGAHTDQAVRTGNTLLAPYTKISDERFQLLREYEQYLRDWEAEVHSMQGVPESIKEKKMLSRQTREGIYITINAFIGATTFLLEEGAKFVNARIFNQDPLEQYFGKQRASGGGQHNPTVSGFLAANTRISIHRDLNVKRRSGNVEGVCRPMEILEEPLPKRKKTK